MRLICIFALMLLPILAFSQEEAFYIEFKDVTLEQAIEQVEEVYQVLFSYKDDYIREKKVTLVPKKRTLIEVLNALEKRSNLHYKLLDDRYVIVSISHNEALNTEALDKVVVRGYLAKGIEKNSDGTYKLFPSRLGILPGLIEPDILESIQLLPGVLSPNETASSFFVRGGASDQNRLIWDGINIYHKGHLFGMISPLNPYVSSEITFINKGAHPKYGERLSSVTDITSRSNIDNVLKAEIGFNGVNVDAILDLPLIKDKLNLQASLRRSYTSAIETFTFKQLSKKVFESTKISEDENSNNDFSFLDFNIKLSYKHNDNNTLFASIIGIDNQLDYISNDTENNRTYNDVMTINNYGYGLGWRHKLNTKLSVDTRAFFSNYKFNYNFITANNTLQISDFEKRNAVYDSGISTEFNYRASEHNTHSFGYQYTLKDVSYAFVNTTNINLILDTEQAMVQSHSIFGNFEYKNPKLFDFSIGLRSSYFHELDALRFEPRISIFKSLNKSIKFQATAEIKNQILSEIDETVFSDLSLENRVWRLSNTRDFPMLNSKHISTGFIYSKKGWFIDADTYYRRLKNINALSLGFLNPDGSTFNSGDQTIYGVDTFVRKRFNGFTSWASYSFNRARSRFQNLNANKSFKSKSHVTHAVSAALSYKLNGFKVALGWKWQTGRPYTIAEGANDNLVFNAGINTGQLPIYHRLDLSSTYSFKMSKQHGLRGKVGISVRNLYNRKNIISREYRGNNSLNDGIVLIERNSLGITPNILFRLYW